MQVSPVVECISDMKRFAPCPIFVILMPSNQDKINFPQDGSETNKKRLFMKPLKL